jgi:hypothetical protein
MSDFRKSIPAVQRPLDAQVFSLAVEEYKLIQTKIDKIGDFCHKVKGWSLTITAGIVAGTASTKVPSWFAIGAIFPILLFKSGDDYQSSLRTVLVARAVELEQFFNRVDATNSCIPSVANNISDKSRQQQRSELAIVPPSPSLQGLRLVFNHNREHWAWHSDRCLYRAQILFVLLAWLAIEGFAPQHPSALEQRAGVALDGLTNSAAWRSHIVTNVIVIKSQPEIPNRHRRHPRGRFNHNEGSVTDNN